MSTLKTTVLLAAMTALFMTIGAALAGQGGALIAFVIAAGMNVFAWWGSDKMVLRMQGAVEVDERRAPNLVAMVRDLAANAGLPMPRVYLIETDQPNAFATGRSPAHAAVAVTSGIMRALSRQELAGVIAHELAHIKHRDTLTMTVTATLAGAIAMIANFALFFRLGGRSGPGIIGTLALMILAPLAAGIVQMAISRTREYEADREGAEICGRPDWLASALERIEVLARRIQNPAAERNPALAHMFIINPLNGGGMDNLFSTHPSTANRVAALRAMTPGARGSAMREAPARARAGGATSGAAPSSVPRAGRRRGPPASPRRFHSGPWT